MSPSGCIAIVGGGLAGTLTAIQLARTAAAPEVVVIDRAAGFGRGVAYGTRSPSHLLNVPAACMSALPDDPDHFHRWAQVEVGAETPRDAFLPRADYGAYVTDLLAVACADGRVRLVHAAVVDLDAGRPCRLHLDDGTTIEADRVVVALGNAAPRDPAVVTGASFYEDRRYIKSPWATGALDAIRPQEPVLLIGSGLTAYDVVLALREQGHRGPIHAVSRHDLRPRRHARCPLAVGGGPSAESWLATPPTARAMLRAVRSACRAALADGRDWRGVIDSLRPVSGRLWARLGASERRRFCRHLRRYWDAYRHRAASPVHDRIEALVAGGTLTLHRGRIRSWRMEAGDVVALLADGRTIRAARVVNCTGPETDVDRTGDPLVVALRARGLVTRDPLGLGVETADDGALVDATGRASTTLFTLGGWRRPALWESVAVPELRAQARALAWRLTAETRAMDAAA
jgi:uncharacterized NAD(P)/FAD-binding protein YdhS